MFAQALKKHLFFDCLKSGENEMPCIIPKKELKHIVMGFLDEDLNNPEIAPYSIQKIARTALEDFKHKPGEWYNPSNINFALEKLHNMQRIKGSENLEILISNDGMVFLDKMLEKIETEKHDCDCEKKYENNLKNGNNNKGKTKEDFFLVKETFDESKKNESDIQNKLEEDSQSSNGFRIISIFFFSIISIF